MAMARAAALSLCAAGAHGLATMGAKVASEPLTLGAQSQDMWPFSKRTAAQGADPKNVTIIMNGEPKSGTTWLEFVLKELITESCDKAAGCDLIPEDRTVTAQTATKLVTFNLSAKHTIPNVGHINKFDFSRAPDLSDAEVEQAAARTLKEATEATRWLIIFRDPRDVTISSCYHMFKDCLNADQYMSQKIGAVTRWIDLRYRLFKALQVMAPQRVKMLFYDHMKNDEEGTIAELADWMGLHLSKEKVARVYDLTTFSSMAKLPTKKVPQGGAASGKVREGAICGYKKDLSEDVEETTTRQMRRILGSELSARFTC